ncbi:MAG TPA: pyruvate kinase [Candidatus Pacearchaeota archaeon]|nr:pyruvate kinase [Candidatus Pacearchaeota archaeon]
MKKKVEIIATIGPSSFSKKVLLNLVKSGMGIARINTKYGSIKEYQRTLNYLRKTRCKIMFDIKNLEILEWIKTQKYDYLAVSFAESKKQIQKIREIVGKKIKIISKIESEKGLENLDELISESDGIMVARGDLGKSIRMEKVPITQKIIIRKCNNKGKMVITATEMLLSMVNSKSPGKAEVSDIANAVLDGSDALMLSEETTIGKYPALALKTMHTIINETEKMRWLLH